MKIIARIGSAMLVLASLGLMSVSYDAAPAGAEGNGIVSFGSGQSFPTAREEAASSWRYNHPSCYCNPYEADGKNWGHSIYPVGI